MAVRVIRERYRRYRRKAKLDEKVTMHTLRYCYAINLIENGATLIQVKELMGHSNIRSTMHYIHVANIRAHKYICDESGHEEIVYNSCRNRNCPNC